MKTHPAQRRRQRVPSFIGAALAGALLAGCAATPPTRYYTLLPAVAASEQRSEAAPRFDWNVDPVVVAAQFDQPQWVVRAADGSLVVLDNERWIAPLGDEIRGAVVERLTPRFGPPNPGSSAAGAPAWRVRIDVQRFDLLPGSEARIVADWSLRGDGQALRCHAAISQPVAAPDYASLARAQQQAVARLADAIAAALERSAKGAAAQC